MKGGTVYSIPEFFHYKGNIIHLCKPLILDEKISWRGKQEEFRKLLAAWYSNNHQDPPFNPLLLGPSGSGKTTLAMAVAQEYDLPMFMMNCQGDMEPNDLTVSLNLDANKNIQYIASPVLTAAMVGGIVLLDEFTRLPQHAFASLASLLDHRRYLEAALLPGLRIPAHPDFRIAFTSNYDSFADLPDYIESRLKPRIVVNNPSQHELALIIDAHLPSPYYAEQFKQKLIEHLIQAKQDGRYREFSTRDAITIGRLAHRYNQFFPEDGDLNIVRALESVIGHI
jgi:MoxR-like ATPase